MQNRSMEKLSSEVEADEAYLGGKVRNMHVDRKRKRGRGTGGVGKEIAMGILERKGKKIKVKHVANAKRNTVQYAKLNGGLPKTESWQAV
jgi:ISXO2-like transposase domain